jgi:hypothetical protein
MDWKSASCPADEPSGSETGASEALEVVSGADASLEAWASLLSVFSACSGLAVRFSNLVSSFLGFHVVKLLSCPLVPFLTTFYAKRKVIFYTRCQGKKQIKKEFFRPGTKAP